MSQDKTRYSPPAAAPDEGDGYYYDSPVPARPIAGNTADDDGIALDQMFEAMDVGPQQYGIPDTKVDKLPKTERLITRTLPLQSGVPLLFLPADAKRKHLTIGVEGEAVVRFASTGPDSLNAAPLRGGGQDGTSYTLTQTYDFPSYSGPVWISTSFAAADGTVCVWAITE